MTLLNSTAMTLLYERGRENPDLQAQMFWYEYLRSTIGPEYTFHWPSPLLVAPDLYVKRADASRSKESTVMVWKGFRRPGLCLRDVELQAEWAARRKLARERTGVIYVLTTVATSYRLWMYTNDRLSLTPFHGSAELGNEAAYVDAAAPDAGSLTEWLELMKKDAPLSEIRTRLYGDPLVSNN